MSILTQCVTVFLCVMVCRLSTKKEKQWDKLVFGFLNGAIVCINQLSILCDKHTRPFIFCQRFTNPGRFTRFLVHIKHGHIYGSFPGAIHVKAMKLIRVDPIESCLNTVDFNPSSSRRNVVSPRFCSASTMAYLGWQNAFATCVDVFPPIVCTYDRKSNVQNVNLAT